MLQKGLKRSVSGVVQPGRRHGAIVASEGCGVRTETYGLGSCAGWNGLISS